MNASFKNAFIFLCLVVDLNLVSTYVSLVKIAAKMRRPGVEPGTNAWKAPMLTVTPSTHVGLLHNLVL